MAKVYVLVTESMYDYECYLSTNVFAKYEDAKKSFDEAVKEEKANDHLMEEDNCIIDEDENDFLIYADGRYVEDHYHIYIEEKEIIE